jgi:hypothetical protein
MVTFGGNVNKLLWIVTTAVLAAHVHVRAHPHDDDETFYSVCDDYASPWTCELSVADQRRMERDVELARCLSVTKYTDGEIDACNRAAAKRLNINLEE